MRADDVLEDCRKALDLVEEARDEQHFRVHWVALVTLLRVVGHVLQKVDAASDSALRAAVEKRWIAWQRDRVKHRLFWDFIETERNSVLKTYDIGVPPGNVQVVVERAEAAEGFTLDECIFKPLLDGPFAGEDGRDVAREAISWWEAQLAAIRSGSE